MTFRCALCKKEYDIIEQGGNCFWDKYCKKCWKIAKEYVGKSWGGKIEDKDYNYD